MNYPSIEILIQPEEDSYIDYVESVLHIDSRTHIFMQRMKDHIEDLEYSETKVDKINSFIDFWREKAKKLKVKFIVNEEVKDELVTSRLED